LSLEDSGNYTCEIRGRGSIVKASVTHYIFMRGKQMAVDKKSPAHIGGLLCCNCAAEK
jgi:hypothetical protein